MRDRSEKPGAVFGEDLQRIARRRVFEPSGVIEDVDVRDLDQNHVVPNMDPPNFHGVWFPRFNV